MTTTDASNNQLVQPVLYAYGGAGPQYFDAVCDCWRSPGYRRKVTLQNDPDDPFAGNAVITDALPLDPFYLNVDEDKTTRLLRYLKAGRTSNVTKLSGAVGRDPWALLTTNITTDARRVAATHLEHAGRLLPEGSNSALAPNDPKFCLDMVLPYDYDQSLSYANNKQDSVDQCAERGFALQTSVTSWRGTPGTAAGTADVISSPQIVKTGSAVTAFDDFGRVTDSTDKGDLADDNNVPNDNVCVHVDYAEPQTAPVRVLNAVAQQTVQDCHDVTLARKRFEYDELTAGQVSNGFITSSTVTRYDGDTHLPLADIRLFDAKYDQTTGILQSTTKTRDGDNARQGTNFTYDPFGLVLTHKDVWSTRTNFDTLSATFIPDPVTLKVTSATGPNGTVQGLAYDGFGRLVRSTVTPPGGTEGALSSLRYDGFELFDIDGDGIPDAPSPGGRKITQKVFTNAVVPPENAGSAPGRITTTFFDKLGRTTGTDIQLGDTYQNQPLVVGSRTYDALGRIRFAADPYSPAFNSFPNTTYGTSTARPTTTTPTARRAVSCAAPVRSRQARRLATARKYFRRALAAPSAITRRSERWSTLIM